jgi:hypothetical protein
MMTIVFSDIEIEFCSNNKRHDGFSRYAIENP